MTRDNYQLATDVETFAGTHKKGRACDLLSEHTDAHGEQMASIQIGRAFKVDGLQAWRVLRNGEPMAEKKGEANE